MYLSVMGINFAFSYECFHWILELFRQYNCWDLFSCTLTLIISHRATNA